MLLPLVDGSMNTLRGADERKRTQRARAKGKGRGPTRTSWRTCRVATAAQSPAAWSG